MITECSLALIKNKYKFLYSLRSKYPYLNFYEFPGGTIENNENPEDALLRECFEELDIKIISYKKIMNITHCYKHMNIKLHIYEIIEYDRNIYPKENQKILYLDALKSNEKFIESTYRILNILSLPRYLKIVSNNDTSISNNLFSNTHLSSTIRLRSSGFLKDDYINQASIYSKICLKNNTRLILDAKYINYYENLKYQGIHFTSQELKTLDADKFIRSKLLTYSASCHSKKEIYLANRLNLDFILLSPIMISKYNHPIGWNKFKDLALEANMPVFALGGIHPSDLKACMSNYGYGVAGMSKF